MKGFSKDEKKRVLHQSCIFAFNFMNSYCLKYGTYTMWWKIVGLVVTIRRATTRTITKLTLEDLSKYFDLPIIEASKRLKVGLTVLKRKCREFGISRWPHRKIKSLDCLIHNLQVCALVFTNSFDLDFVSCNYWFPVTLFVLFFPAFA